MRAAVVTAGVSMPARARPAGALRVPMAAALGVLGLAAVALVATAAAAPSPLVPASRAGFPDWLAGPLRLLGAPALTQTGIGIGLLVMTVAYLALLALDRSAGVPARWAIAAIVGLHVVFLLGPPTTTDLFGYLGYARLPALHGLDPYTHGAEALLGDPVHRWLIWHGDPSPYGPLFTVGSYATVPLGVAGGMWALKIFGTLCSLAMVALVARAARSLGRASVSAALFVGLNPLLLVYTVGGAHNDLWMMAAVLAAVVLVLERRDAASGALAAVAVAIKVTALAPLVFLVPLARRKGSLALGAVGAAVGVGLVSLAVLGPAVLHAPAATAAQQAKASAFSPVKTVAGWFGGASDATLTHVATGLRLAGLAVLGVRAWRGADAIAGAAWASLVLITASAWMKPWYAVLVLPLAALAPTVAPRVAALALCAFILVTKVQLG